MEALRRKIAESILAASAQDERPMPAQWRIQVPTTRGNKRIVMFEPLDAKHDGPSMYKHLTVALPESYTDSDYEAALEGLIPETLSDDYTVPQYNSSVRIVSAELLEKGLDRAIHGLVIAADAPAFEASLEWDLTEGVGWVRTPGFSVHATETDDESYLDARSADNKRHAIIREKRTGKEETNGRSVFNFDDAYILKDRRNGFEEEIEISKTIEGSYGVKFKKADF